MKIEVDVEQFARDIKSGKGIGGADGALSSLIKQLTEAALAAEIDSHLPKLIKCFLVFFIPELFNCIKSVTIKLFFDL